MTRRKVVWCGLVSLFAASILIWQLCLAEGGRYPNAGQQEPAHRHRSNNLHDLNGMSSQDFGLLGPLSIAALYDTELGYITDGRISASMGKHMASALEVAGGARVLRINGTLGALFNQRNRAKVTVEYLDEKLKYDFDSGHVRRWDDQIAVGGTYQYLLSKWIFDSVDVGGYYVHSGSRSLSDKQYTVGGETCINKRHIAGADAGNVSVALGYHFWPNSQLKTGMRWDKIHYRDKYHAGRDANGLGVLLGADQLITDRIKIAADWTYNQSDNRVGGQLGVLLPSPRATRLELSYVTDYSYGRTTHREFFTNGARLAFGWGYPNRKPSYSADFGAPNNQTLRQWTSDPAVRMSEVLAITDQATTNLDGTPKDRRSIDTPPSASSLGIEEGEPLVEPVKRRRSTTRGFRGNKRWAAKDLAGKGKWVQQVTVGEKVVIPEGNTIVKKRSFTDLVIGVEHHPVAHYNIKLSDGELFSIELVNEDIYAKPKLVTVNTETERATTHHRRDPIWDYNSRTGEYTCEGNGAPDYNNPEKMCEFNITEKY